MLLIILLEGTVYGQRRQVEQIVKTQYYQIKKMEMLCYILTIKVYGAQ